MKRLRTIKIPRLDTTTKKRKLLDSSEEEYETSLREDDDEMKIDDDIEYSKDKQDYDNSNYMNTRSKRTNNKKYSQSKITSKKNKSKPKNKKKEFEEESDIESGKENEEIDFLPCREQEQKKIYLYIKEGLQTRGAYSSLYIAGMPGTGKTASVQTVLKKLAYESNQNKISKFNELYINGMKFTNPTNVFKTIYNFIFEDHKNQNVKNYIHYLDNFFKNREDFNLNPVINDPINPHLILIIDEVDCLINQKQNLLYNIFNWTTYSQSKLIVISISNTLDLPNKLLPKIQSRMGNNKIMFRPYVKDELYKIISVKIQDVHLFSEDALKLSSMKVAAVNGDLRRILQICKRAKEIYVNERQTNSSIKLILKKHIIQACNELFDSKVVKVIQSLQISEKIILATILSRIKANNDNKILVSELYDKKDLFINKANEDEKNRYLSMNWEEFQMIIYNLVNLKIISFSEHFNENFIDNTICIKFYTDEFMNAVEGQKEFENVFQFLQTLLNEK